ncbi:MAG: NADH-quinone oxidoreductase subunit N [Saprospiraceae bacterium]|nr:NADH-quinone oxidoreductase subunit N [Saprospiraceae bacterium]MDZ4705675.1 NADH-quinone oxidoreductase subunit N [Saprospiraceae bacterium]
MKALIILALTGVFTLFAGLNASKRSVVQVIAATGLGLALVATIWDRFWAAPFSIGNMLTFDHYALAFGSVAILITLLIVLLGRSGYQGDSENFGDFKALLVFSLCGALCLFSFDNLIMLFLGIEILSIPLYVLAGIRKNYPASNEAALKYFFMGAFATGILLFGITLIYGASASFSLSEISKIASSGNQLPGMLKVGILMVLIGLSFKVAAAPFHFWSPDVYEGSPNLVTLFMATVVKMAGFGAFFRLFDLSFAQISGVWAPTLAVMALLTMSIGNLTALFQTGFKRMLAYSSIAHAGYLLLGILACTRYGGGALLLYTLAYAVATVCAFTVFILVAQEKPEETTGMDAFRGLGRRQPLAAFAMTLAMLSMAGIPPLAGFFGKYFLFAQAFPDYFWLVIAAVVNSAISIVYYFRVITEMYFKPSDGVEAAPLTLPLAYRFVLVAAILILFAISILPGLILSWVG